LWGVVALLADILKGTPFILIAKSVVGLAAPFLYLIAFCAILGHAFSPFLGFRGGKALAVFGGTLLALNQWDVITVLAVLFLAGFFFIGNDSWIVILGILVTFVFCLWMRSDVWQIAFVGCVTALFIYKHWDGLKAPNHSGRLVNWIRSRKKPA
jgi:glycerol-3-phosphate acyltransferase PlsY